jgi:signal peptidase
VRWVRRVCLGMLAVSVVAGAAVGLNAWQHGERLYVVHTGSMTPTFKPGDVVFDVPPSTLHRGEAVTFRPNPLSTSVVTHRIYRIHDGDIRTKGDANRTPDTWTIHPAQVTGAVRTTIPKLGYAIVYLQQKAGIASIMTAALALLMLWGLFFPASLAEATPAIVTSAAGSAMSGVNRLRGHGRERRAAPGAIETLRSGGIAAIS